MQLRKTCAQKWLCFLCGSCPPPQCATNTEDLDRFLSRQIYIIRTCQIALLVYASVCCLFFKRTEQNVSCHWSLCQESYYSKGYRRLSAARAILFRLLASDRFFLSVSSILLCLLSPQLGMATNSHGICLLPACAGEPLKRNCWVDKWGLVATFNYTVFCNSLEQTFVLQW